MTLKLQKTKIEICESVVRISTSFGTEVLDLNQIQKYAHTVCQVVRSHLRQFVKIIALLIIKYSIGKCFNVVIDLVINIGK